MDTGDFARGRGGSESGFRAAGCCTPTFGWVLSTAGESVVVGWLGLMSTTALGGTGAAVSQLHCAVSAMGVFDSAGAVPLVVGSVPVLLGAGSVSTGADVRTGAGVPLIADVTLAWAPVTTDFVSSTALEDLAHLRGVSPLGARKPTPRWSSFS